MSSARLHRRGTVPGWVGWALVLALAGAGPVAGPPDLAAVAAWVAVELGEPAPAELPHVAFAAPDEMRQRRYGVAAADGTAVLDLVALYDDDTRTIYLPAGWTGVTPRETSILVHEMVHHVQVLSGRRYGCAGEREREAYALQDLWLARSGQRLETAFGMNGLALMVLTRCGR